MLLRSLRTHLCPPRRGLAACRGSISGFILLPLLLLCLPWVQVACQRIISAGWGPGARAQVADRLRVHWVVPRLLVVVRRVFRQFLLVASLVFPRPLVIVSRRGIRHSLRNRPVLQFRLLFRGQPVLPLVSAAADRRRPSKEGWEVAGIPLRQVCLSFVLLMHHLVLGSHGQLVVSTFFRCHERRRILL